MSFTAELQEDEKTFPLSGDCGARKAPFLPSPILKINHLSKIYASSKNKTVALSDINLSIYPREMICLIGESGCGKSTLLQIIAGFEKPSSGNVLMNDKLISGPNFKRGVVFQEQSLLPWLTVKKNIRLGLNIRKVKKNVDESLVDVIKAVGLTGFEDYYPAQLSGGMAQRVAIARAIINNPDILLLDEPFGALDAFTRMKLQDELIRLWEQTQFTSIFVTHDIDEAVYLGNRIIILTPRPGKMARVFSIPLRYPRDRTSPEFIRLRGMIAKEFMHLSNEERKLENLREI